MMTNQYCKSMDQFKIWMKESSLDEEIVSLFNACLTEIEVNEQYLKGLQLVKFQYEKFKENRRNAESSSSITEDSSIPLFYS